ncbi:MAG: hypothetical protein MUE50_24105 [Pirellulaceae bacterium]|nr:hypothetical protein [Pirellulaceae bacterium]
MSRILALWLPNWPVQRLVRDQPELTGRALVLYEQDARHGQRVKACSAAAEQQAVRPGMPLAEAQTLLAGPAKEEQGRVGRMPAAGGFGGGGRPAPSAAQTPLAEAPLFICHDARRDQEALVEFWPSGASSSVPSLGSIKRTNRTRCSWTSADSRTCSAAKKRWRKPSSRPGNSKG